MHMTVLTIHIDTGIKFFKERSVETLISLLKLKKRLINIFIRPWILKNDVHSRPT